MKLLQLSNISKILQKVEWFTGKERKFIPSEESEEVLTFPCYIDRFLWRTIL